MSKLVHGTKIAPLKNEKQRSKSHLKETHGEAHELKKEGTYNIRSNTKTLYLKFSNSFRCTEYSHWRICSKLSSLLIFRLEEQFLEPLDNLIKMATQCSIKLSPSSLVRRDSSSTKYNVFSD